VLNFLAQVALLTPPSPCAVAGGTPTVVAYMSEATVEHEWNATWTTRPPGPPWSYPDVPSLVVVGLQPVTPAQLPNGGGCWLMVNPDTWVIPRPSSPLTQQAGMVQARLRLPRELAGVTIYLQLLSADARTLIGVVTSPMLVVTAQRP
jgi:hypothetical protein